MNKPLSNEQVCNAVPGSAWLKYNELTHYNSIDEVLSLSTIRVVFLLILIESESSGHWCLLAGDEARILFFDAYGYVCDSELSFLSAEKRRELHEDTPLLMRLMLKSSQHKPWTWNSWDLQKHSNTVQTCGRWCVLRARNLDLDDDAFREMVSSSKDPDRTCMRLTSDIK